MFSLDEFAAKYSIDEVGPAVMAELRRALPGEVFIVMVCEDGSFVVGEAFWNSSDVRI